MKKIFLTVAIVLFGFTFAQENSIKANPLAYFGGNDLVSYEKKIKDNSSGVVSGSIGGFNFGGYKYSTFGVGLQYRYYFGEAMTKWYVAGVTGFSSGSVEIDNLSSFWGDGTVANSEADLKGFNIGARAGYQWIFDSGLTLDLNLGLGYTSFSYDWENTADELAYENLLKVSGILPSGSVGIGYSF